MEYKVDLSIIVPVYNVEKYIKKCIDSLINQKSLNFKYEIICVNDGSNDRSLEILKSYERQCKEKIKIIDIENRGVSNARNIGLKNANGKFIAFVDSDDWVEESFVRNLLEVANDEMLVVCDSYFVFNDKMKYNKENIDDTVFNVENAVWGKLFSKKIIDKYNIKFPTDITMGEDLVFTFCYLCCVENYIKLRKSIYFYRAIRENSLMNSNMKYKYKQVFKACDYVYTFAKENDLLTNKYEEIEYLFVKNLIVRNTIKVIKFESGITSKINNISEQINFIDRYFPKWSENRLVKSDVDGYLSKKLGKRYLDVLFNLQSRSIRIIYYFIIGKVM